MNRTRRLAWEFGVAARTAEMQIWIIQMGITYSFSIDTGSIPME